MKLLKKGQFPIFFANCLALAVFIFIFIARNNFEFLIYVGVLIFFMALILATNSKINYPNGLLWGLSVWALAHMAGGGIFIGDTKLYGTLLIPIIGEPYHVLKYDQLVHAYGFGVTTFVMWHLLKPSLKQAVPRRWVSLGIILVMAATGAGALNEVIEFTATVFDPDNGVGGYVNNAIDLVANLVGALIATMIIIHKEMNKK